MTYKLEKEHLLLLSIVVLAILVRIIFIWVGRPEFVGWFNHTYYYYVETKGLLSDGKLPYPDMPILFFMVVFRKLCK
jgi:ABC-type transporter Mla subunit MlaD